MESCVLYECRTTAIAQHHQVLGAIGKQKHPLIIERYAIHPTCGTVLIDGMTGGAGYDHQISPGHPVID